MKGDGEFFLAEGVELIACPYAYQVTRSIAFEIEGRGIFQCAVGVHAEKGILCGSVQVGKSEGNGGSRVRVRCGEMKKVRIDGQVFVHHQGGTGLDVIGGQVAVGGESGNGRPCGCGGVDCLDGEEIGRAIGKSRNGVG